MRNKTTNIKKDSVICHLKKYDSFQIYNLEETLRGTQVEYGQRLAPLNKLIRDLEKELKAVRSQVEHLVENNKNLLCVKMKLEAEIENYRKLIQGMTADTER